ncbi:MAG: PcfJ domain-containing protein [Myxococcota bacterium]
MSNRKRQARARRREFENQRQKNERHRRLRKKADKARFCQKQSLTPSAIFDRMLQNIPLGHGANHYYSLVIKEILSDASSVRPGRFRQLLCFVEAHIRRCLMPNRLLLLALLSRVGWVRPLETWTPRRKSHSTRLRMLLEHLLVRYDAPSFLIDELIVLTQGEFILRTQQKHRLNERFALLAYLGAGGSLKGARDQGMLPSTLTRRMLHRVCVSRGVRDLVDAVRQAQLEPLNARPALIDAIRESFLGQRFVVDEPFWWTILQWLAHHQFSLPPDGVGPLLDFIRHRKQEREALDDRAWSIKGRTPESMMRQMHVWHGDLAMVSKVRRANFTPSGFSPSYLRVGEGESVQLWSVTEILTTKALAAEGRAQRHCVFSYSRTILSGQTSIWSVRLNGDRVLTVEVSHEMGRVVQVRGKANRMPRSKERDIVRRWAAENGLRYG